MRAVANRPVKIRFRLEDEGGVLTDADASTNVAVVVTDGAGGAIAGGTGNAAHESTGVYTFTLASPPTQYDVLTAKATATLGGDTVTMTEQVRLVDRRLVPLSTLRALPELAPLSLSDFLATVDETEDWVTSILNFSPVVTGERATFRLRDYTARLDLPGIFHPRDVYSVSYNDVVYDPTKLSSLVVRSRSIEYQSAYYTAGYDPVLGIWGPMFPPGVYSAWISHGKDDVSQEIVRAAKKLAQHSAKTSNYPDRATRIMSEASEIWLSTPDGKTRLTGLPEVDGVLLRHRIDLPFAEDSGTF